MTGRGEAPSSDTGFLCEIAGWSSAWGETEGGGLEVGGKEEEPGDKTQGRLWACLGPPGLPILSGQWDQGIRLWGSHWPGREGTEGGEGQGGRGGTTGNDSVRVRGQQSRQICHMGRRGVVGRKKNTDFGQSGPSPSMGLFPPPNPFKMLVGVLAKRAQLDKNIKMGETAGAPEWL